MGVSVVVGVVRGDSREFLSFREVYQILSSQYALNLLKCLFWRDGGWNKMILVLSLRLKLNNKTSVECVKLGKTLDLRTSLSLVSSWESFAPCKIMFNQDWTFLQFSVDLVSLDLVVIGLIEQIGFGMFGPLHFKHFAWYI